MSRRRVVTAEIADRAKELKRKGLSYQEVADELGLSVGSVANALKVPKGEAPGGAGSAGGSGGGGRAPRLPKGPPRARDGAARASAVDVGLEALDEQLEDLREQAAKQRLEGNESGYNQTAARINATIAQREKLTPVEAPDPEARPDMQAAAKAAREKLREYVRRRSAPAERVA